MLRRGELALLDLPNPASPMSAELIFFFTLLLSFSFGSSKLELFLCSIFLGESCSSVVHLPVLRS
jgi:hypothetical protein